MLKSNSSENFLSRPKLDKFWQFRGLGVKGYKKLRFFAAKATSVREFTSIKPFCVKIGWTV